MIQVRDDPIIRAMESWGCFPGGHKNARGKNLSVASEEGNYIPLPLFAKTAYPLPPSSVPNRTHFAGLRFGDAGYPLSHAAGVTVPRSGEPLGAEDDERENEPLSHGYAVPAPLGKGSL